MELLRVILPVQINVMYPQKHPLSIQDHPKNFQYRITKVFFFEEKYKKIMFSQDCKARINLQKFVDKLLLKFTKISKSDERREH